MYNIRRDILKKAIEKYQIPILKLTNKPNQIITFIPSGDRCRQVKIEAGKQTFLIPVKDIITKEPKNILQYQI